MCVVSVYDKYIFFVDFFMMIFHHILSVYCVWGGPGGGGRLCVCLYTHVRQCEMIFMHVSSCVVVMGVCVM